MPQVNTETKIVTCILYGKRHETVAMYGLVYIPCPEMPKDFIVPTQTIKVFVTGKSMPDQPFIVVQ